MSPAAITRTLDRPAQQVAERCGGLGVEGIGDGHQQALAPVSDWNNAIALEELQLQTVGQQRHLRQLTGIKQRQAEEFRQQPGKVCLGDKPKPGQYQVETLAGLPPGTQRPMHGQLVQNPARREKRGEPLDQFFVAGVRSPARRPAILIDHRFQQPIGSFLVIFTSRLSRLTTAR